MNTDKIQLYNDIMSSISIIVKQKIDESFGIKEYDNIEFNKEIQNIAEKIIFTGPIDKFFDYKFGTLEYRTVDFETTKLEINN